MGAERKNRVDKSNMLFLLGIIPIGICALLGWHLLFGKDVQSFVYRIRMEHRLREMRKEKARSPWLEKLDRSLCVVLPGAFSSELFLGGSVFLFFVSFITGLRSFSLIVSVFLGILIASVPFLFLYLRLEKLRKRGSREGELLLSEFLRQYRISERNIYQTLERLVEEGKKTRVTNKLLFRLLLELRDTGNPERMRKAAEEFAYALGTNWGRMLSYNIYLAAAKGSDISVAAEDILIQLRDARNLEEERKRMNSESFRMTTFMVPITYVLTVFMASACLDIRIGTFLYNQICTAEGLLFLLLIIFLFILNQTVLSLVSNQKFDY